MKVTQTGAAYFWANLKDQLRMAFEGTTINITRGGPRKPYAQVSLCADIGGIKDISPLAMDKINSSSYGDMRQSLRSKRDIYITGRGSHADKVIKISRALSF